MADCKATVEFMRSDMAAIYVYLDERGLKPERDGLLRTRELKALEGVADVDENGVIVGFEFIVSTRGLKQPAPEATP